MCHIIDGMNVYAYNQCSVYMKNTSIRPKYIFKKNVPQLSSLRILNNPCNTFLFIQFAFSDTFTKEIIKFFR